jgi:diguanylate cyclase (GGDEF)-like protein
MFLSEPSPRVLDSLTLARRIALTSVEFLALLSLAVWLIPSFTRAFAADSPFMSADASFLVLLAAFSLHLSDSRLALVKRLLSLVLASVITLLAASLLLAGNLHFDLTLGNSAAMAGIPARLALCFAFFGITIILLHIPHPLTRHITDMAVFTLVLLVLIVCSEYLFSFLSVFEASSAYRASPVLLFCLFLLALLTLVRCAEKGVFSILLGRGIGGRIVRLVSPVILFLPFVREVGRANIVHAHRLSGNFATAILTSLAAMASFGLLLFIAWRINAMEKEIHDLSLRDELTGLYNLRGFHLLAEQALLLAKRSNLPFSVLFIDLDNLKRINDAHGHLIGSQTLTETGALLQTTFRETDVIARIGGDEFAVAGQFSQEDIAVACDRLRQASCHRNANAGEPATLSFSIGHVTSLLSEHESIRLLLSQADEAMYREKREKKHSIPALA